VKQLRHSVTRLRDFGEVRTAVDELDLAPVLPILMRRSPEFTAAEAVRDLELYRWFLLLCAQYPDWSFVPSGQIEQAWRAHLVDTQKYRTDCEALFGEPLECWPYAGEGSPEQQIRYQCDWMRTVQLFREHFATDMSGPPARCCARIPESATRPSGLGYGATDSDGSVPAGNGR
jgi:hypothetical protein